VAHPADAVTVGDRVSVKILKLEEAQGRISLSIRQAEEDPWESAKTSYEVGQPVTGTVRRLAEFGAFVELRPGIEALAAARDFPPAAEGWKHGLEIGHAREWVISSIEPSRKRMSLVLAREGGTPGPVQIENGARLKGRVQKVERFGVFVWLGPGRVGLVPTAWTGVARGVDLEKKFSTGSELGVEVIEIADGGRRIRLAIEGVPRPATDEGRKPEKPQRPPKSEPAAQAEREAREKAPAASPASASFGTNLGDALRAALVKKEAERS
jgi:small subunit ribosomal protein S1